MMSSSTINLSSSLAKGLLNESSIGSDSIKSLIKQKESELREINEYRVTALESALTEKDMELETLKKRLKSLQDDFLYNLKLVEERDSELDQLTSTVQRQERQLAEANARSSSAEKLSAEYKEKLSNVETFYVVELDRLRSSNSALEKSTSELREYYERENSARSSEYTRQMEAIGREMSALKEETLRLSSVESERTELQRELKRAEEENSRLSAEFSRLTQQLRELSSTSDGHLSKIRQLEQEQQRSQDLTQSAARAHADRVASLEAQLAVAREERERALHAHSRLLEEYERKMESMIASLKSVENDFAEQTSSFEQQQQQLRQALQAAEQRLEQERADREAELQRQRAETQRLRFEKDAERSRLEGLLSQRNAAFTELEQRAAAKETEWNSYLRSLESSGGAVAEDLKRAEAELAEVRSKLVEEERRSAAAESKVLAGEAREAELRALAEGALRAHVEEVRTLVSQRDLSLRQIHSRLRAGHLRVVSSSSSSLSSSSADIVPQELAPEDILRALDGLEVARASDLAEIASLRLELSTLRQRAESVDSAHSEAQNDLKQLRESLQSAQASAAAALERAQAAESRAAAAEESAESAENARRREIDFLLEEGTARRAQLDQANQALGEARASVEMLQRQLEEQRTAAEQTRNSIEHQHAEELAHLKLEKQEQLAQLKLEKQQELMQQQQQHQEEMRSMQQQLERETQRNEAAELSSRRLKEVVADMRQHVEQLQSETGAALEMAESAAPLRSRAERAEQQLQATLRNETRLKAELDRVRELSSLLSARLTGYESVSGEPEVLGQAMELSMLRQMVLQAGSSENMITTTTTATSATENEAPRTPTRATALDNTLRSTTNGAEASNVLSPLAAAEVSRLSSQIRTLTSDRDRLLELSNQLRAQLRARDSPQKHGNTYYYAENEEYSEPPSSKASSGNNLGTMGVPHAEIIIPRFLPAENQFQTPRGANVVVSAEKMAKLEDTLERISRQNADLKLNVSALMAGSSLPQSPSAAAARRGNNTTSSAPEKHMKGGKESELPELSIQNARQLTDEARARLERARARVHANSLGSQASFLPSSRTAHPAGSRSSRSSSPTAADGSVYAQGSSNPAASAARTKAKGLRSESLSKVRNYADLAAAEARNKN